MANELLTKESASEQIKAYFEGILRLYKSGEEFPINLDDVWMLVYSEKSKAVRALKKSLFEEGIDYNLAQNGEVIKSSEIQNGIAVTYKLSVKCLEFFIARKVRAVFEVYRNVFQKVATGEVAVAKNTTMTLPDFSNPAEAARAWANEYEQKMIATKRADEAEQQVLQLTSEIEQMQPKVSYYDMILNNKSTVLTTQIAQDYGMSAKSFNKMLENFRVQHKVNHQWILYAPYISQGYVQSKAVTITHSDGHQSVKYNTEWSQKGRLFLYDGLKRHGILPLIER